MLEQIAKHGAIDLFLHTTGDLHIDEHHTMEDTAIVLGKLFNQSLGKKPEYRDTDLFCRWMKQNHRF